MVTRNTAPQRAPDDDDRTVVGHVLFALATAAVKRAPREMSLTSMSTLSTLERSGPRRITDLAAVEGVTQPSMTALVSGLERAGLVERRTDPADKRVALVALTARGADDIYARRRAGADAFARLIEKLPARQADTLAAALPALEQLRDLEEERWDPSGGADGPNPPRSGGAVASS